jgi:hypothetical protein
VTGGLGIYFLPSLIAIGFASFQVRRLEMPARTAERPVPWGRRRGKVIDAESREVDADEVVDDDVIEAEVVDEEPPPRDREDALAELEAELAAEDAAGADEAGGKAGTDRDTDAGGNGGRTRPS